MDINQFTHILNNYENKELTVTIVGNNSFCADITNVDIIEEGKILLLYESSYDTGFGKHLLSPIKTVKDILSILDGIKDKTMQVKGRGTNGVLVSPTDCEICYIDNYVMLNLYDRSIPVTIEKTKKRCTDFYR